MNERREQVEKLVREVIASMADRNEIGPIPATAGVQRDTGEVRFAAGRRPMLAANWKMNKLRSEAIDFTRRFDPLSATGVDVVICPPFLLVPLLREAFGPDGAVSVGAQNLHPEPSGAFTGECSAAQVADTGARHVIVGHSERRAMMGEDDPLVRRKLEAALGAGLTPILCIGEQLSERDSGATFRVLRNQLTVALASLGPPAPGPDRVVVAYEPVWAIGTGRSATPDQAQEVHGFVRDRLAELFDHGWASRVRILYGGSASPANVAALAAGPDVDGFLVGGAGLDPEKLSTMIAVTAEAKKRPDSPQRR